jgi:hypothetical protein
MGIEQVPTFLFFQSGREISRIVEAEAVHGKRLRILAAR